MKKALFLTVLIINIFIGFSQTPISATIAYQGYDETQAYIGQGEYQIFIDNTDGVLDKPIIVIDGYDPGDARDITSLYSALDYDGTNMADVLRNEGFDFVFLNFPVYTRSSDNVEVDGGTDYIQRNAMILSELINQINNQKVGSEELVVIGPSMGGLISRYALRYMEQNSIDHQTRLYVSWDSPHGGVNVPIDLQYLLNYFAEVNGGNADLQAAIAATLSSPASKEMLIDHFSTHIQDGSTFEQDPSILLPIGATNFRDAFQSELDAMGFPQQTRNISIANGSSNGTIIGTPGMEILNHTFDVPNVNDTTIDIELHFTPLANQTIEVTKALTINTTLGFPVTVADFSASSQSFSYTDGLDSAPGSKSSIEAFFGGGQGNDLIIELIDNLQQSDFSFISTISSMAIDNENNIYNSIDIPNTHNTPFDAWYIPTENEYHVTPTDQNMAFLLPEIRNQVASNVKTEFNSAFKLKTNPVTNNIILTTNNDYNNVTISIISITGKNIITNKFNNVSNIIEFPINISNGLYFLRAIADGKTFTKKIIVNK